MRLRGIKTMDVNEENIRSVIRRLGTMRRFFDRQYADTSEVVKTIDDAADLIMAFNVKLYEKEREFKDTDSRLERLENLAARYWK